MSESQRFLRAVYGGYGRSERPGRGGRMSSLVQAVREQARREVDGNIVADESEGDLPDNEQPVYKHPFVDEFERCLKERKKTSEEAMPVDAVEDEAQNAPVEAEQPSEPYPHVPMDSGLKSLFDPVVCDGKWKLACYLPTSAHAPGAGGQRDGPFAGFTNPSPVDGVFAANAVAKVHIDNVKTHVRKKHSVSLGKAFWKGTYSSDRVKEEDPDADVHWVKARDEAWSLATWMDKEPGVPDGAWKTAVWAALRALADSNKTKRKRSVQTRPGFESNIT